LLQKHYELSLLEDDLIIELFKVHDFYIFYQCILF